MTHAFEFTNNALYIWYDDEIRAWDIQSMWIDALEIMDEIERANDISEKDYVLVIARDTFNYNLSERVQTMIDGLTRDTLKAIQEAP